MAAARCGERRGAESDCAVLGLGETAVRRGSAAVIGHFHAVAELGVSPRGRGGRDVRGKGSSVRP